MKVGLNSEQILSIIAHQREFRVSKYRDSDYNLRKKIRKMIREGLIFKKREDQDAKYYDSVARQNKHREGSGE